MNLEEYKKQIEAILFTVGRPLDTQQIAEMLSLGSTGMVKNALTELKKEYSEKNSALEIIEDSNKFRMNIKGEHMHLVRDLMPITELDKSTLETLAIIAWKHPVLQSDVVKIRGNKTYEHMKTLVENDFVSTTPTGLSKTIKLTPKFFQYFDTNKDKITKQLEEEALKQLPEIEDPCPSEVPSEEMPKMPGSDIGPISSNLKEEKKQKEDV
ncbi:MAG: SMC-Scp complex subunit ScpB [Nanoarchaeota archaeon]|nr:SMC-Scp complex subunit ScpB [Nanoarchaeota archaeon]